jgi:hypothetical protein
VDDVFGALRSQFSVEQKLRDQRKAESERQKQRQLAYEAVWKPILRECAAMAQDKSYIPRVELFQNLVAVLLEEIQDNFVRQLSHT